MNYRQSVIDSQNAEREYKERMEEIQKGLREYQKNCPHKEVTYHYGCYEMPQYYECTNCRKEFDTKPCGAKKV